MCSTILTTLKPLISENLLLEAVGEDTKDVQILISNSVNSLIS